jgi:TadE-like protein
MIRLIRRLTRFRRRETGNATIEFVILFPMFMILVVSGIEAGMLMTRQLMLERGLDLTMRELRLGEMGTPDHNSVRAEICKNAIIIPNCLQVMRLEMAEVDTSNWTIPLHGDRCVDRTAEFNISDEPPDFDAGERNKPMMIRACVVFDPMFPTAGLGAQLPRDASGGYRLMATTGFMNEP